MRPSSSLGALDVASHCAGLPLEDLSAVFLARSQDVALLEAHSCGLCPLDSYIALSQHVNAEQRARCDRAEMLHTLSHMSDDAVCDALLNGHFAWANLTSSDIRLNRKLRGPCVQCLEGKFRGKPMLPSVNPPASAVGMCLEIDTQELHVKSIGGNLCYLDCCDEFSGDLQVTPCKSLKSVDIFNAIMALVHARYNAHGHRVTHIVVDALPAYTAVIPMLGMMGILLTQCPPGQHVQRLEARLGHKSSTERSINASLPFYMPKSTELYLKKYVADCANEYPNSRSFPSTANLIVTGRSRVSNARMPFTKYGDTCMVPVSKDKRLSDARLNDVSLKVVHKSELGVCLGFTPNSPSGSYEFLLENGEVVSRNHFDRVHVHPFGWKRKCVLHAELAPPSTGVAPQESVQRAPLADPPLDVPPLLPSTALSPSSLPWHPAPVPHPASPAPSRHDVPEDDLFHVAPPAPAPPSVVSSSQAVAFPLPALPIPVPDPSLVSTALSPAAVASAPPVLPAAPTPLPPAGWVEPRRSTRARNATYNPHDMPPLHSALISPSYDEFLVSLRRDLTFEEFVAAMRFAPPQFPVPAPAACASPPVVHRSRHPPRRGKRGHSKRPHASAPVRSDVLSHADQALLAPYLRDVRADWLHTVDVIRPDELSHTDALSFLAHGPDDGVASCLSASSVSLPSSVLLPVPSVKCKEV